MSILQRPIPKANSFLARQQLVDEIYSNLMCIGFGTITKYDKVKQVATIKPSFLQTVASADSAVQLQSPLLVNIPVIRGRGKRGGLRFPISDGDMVVLLFGDRSIDKLKAGLDPAIPNSARMHHRNDAVALPFFHNLKTMQIDDNDGTSVEYNRTKMTLTEDKIVIENPTKKTEVEMTQNIHLKTELAQILITNKIKLANDQQNWKANMNTWLEKAQAIVDQINAFIDKASDIAQAVADSGTALAGATTVPAAPGATLAMNPGTITNATKVTTDASAAKAGLVPIKQQLTTLKTDLGTVKSNLDLLFD